MVRHDSDRGAILIHTAFAMMGLILFSAFVADYGTFWVARRQAQNAADAGALAGAVARVYDDTSNPPSTTSGVVHDSVMNAVATNLIWGQAPPANTVTLDYTCPDGTTKCVSVDVYRDGTHNSTALPTFFMRFAGVNSQGTRAHAVSKLNDANGTGCLRPWFLVDPNFTTPDDFGTPEIFHENVSPSGYSQLRVDGNGGKQLEDAIEQCASIDGNKSFGIGTVVDTKPGGTQGPEAHGVQTLIDWDNCNGKCSNATVVGTGKDATVSGGCADTDAGCVCKGNPGDVCPNGPHISPRVAVVALCQSSEADCNTGGPNNGSITITNFMSFFVVGCNGDVNQCKNGSPTDINAILIGTAGKFISSGGVPTGENFLYAITLIR
jgi:hypothetical protein